MTGAGRVTSDTTFDANGSVLFQQTYYAGTTSTHESILNGITGTSYNAFDYVYAPDGTPTHQTLYAGAHVPIYEYIFDPATGKKSTSYFDSNGALSKTTTTNLNGTYDTRSYQPSGASSDFFYDAGNQLTKRDIYDTATHKSETLTYDNGGHIASDTTYDAAGAVTYDAIYYPGTTTAQHQDLYGVTGTSYHAMHSDFDTGGGLIGQTLDLNDGSYVRTAYGDGRTLISTAGAPDSLRAPGSNETFVFHAGMGHDTVASFVATGSGHDVLSFDAALLPAMGATSDDLLNAYASAPSANSVLLTFSPDNSVLINGASLATLHANPGDFSFV